MKEHEEKLMNKVLKDAIRNVINSYCQRGHKQVAVDMLYIVAGEVEEELSTTTTLNR